MPVRIYDIAKKLGIENKEVLAKAKELGIATARVPSSSLDKITAEYLESPLKPAAPAAPEPAAAPSLPPEPVLIVSAPPTDAPALAVAEAPGSLPEPATDAATDMVAQQAPVLTPPAAEVPPGDAVEA